MQLNSAVFVSRIESICEKMGAETVSAFSPHGMVLNNVSSYECEEVQ